MHLFPPTTGPLQVRPSLLYSYTTVSFLYMASFQFMITFLWEFLKKCPSHPLDCKLHEDQDWLCLFTSVTPPLSTGPCKSVGYLKKKSISWITDIPNLLTTTLKFLALIKGNHAFNWNREPKKTWWIICRTCRWRCLIDNWKLKYVAQKTKHYG